MSPPMLIADWTAVCSGPLAWRDPALLAWLGCGAPLLEEWVFRAGLQAALLRRAAVRIGPAARERVGVQVGAIVLTALAFSLLHLGRGIDSAALALPMALVVGLVYQHTGDWFVCACAHAVANVCAWFLCLPFVH